MKKLSVLLTTMLVMVSCGHLDEKGNMTDYGFVGKFHGITVYSVQTPGGTTLYIGVKDDKALPFTQHRVSNGKGGGYNVPLIQEDQE